MLPQRVALPRVTAMSIRTRKFIGTVALVLFLAGYAIVAMAFGASTIVGSSALYEGLYFLIAGLAWVIPAGFLVRWMQRPD